MVNKEILDEEIKTRLLKDGYIKSVKELAQLFGVAEGSLNHYLLKHGYRDRDIFTQLPRNFIKSFDTMTQECSYWLGYIQADGCISYSRGHLRLVLECKADDKELLENFCNFTNINKRRIRNTKHTNSRTNTISQAVRLDLADNCFSTSLSNWFSCNKSSTDSNIPPGVDFYDYLLGLIDGDGGFYNGDGGAQMILLCRKPMVDEIISQLQKDLPNPSSIWLYNHPTTVGLYRLVVGCGAKRCNFHYLYKQFYEDKNYNSLQRKKIALKQAIDK